MKFIHLVILALSTVLFFSCQNSNNIETDDNMDPELAKKELFNKVYTSDNLESQIFRINSEKDTSVVTKNGTIYRIYNNSFESIDGSKIPTSIEIEIKEAITPLDFVLANLTTLTDKNELLESGGMIYINATSNGKQLKISAEKEIGIMLPNDSVKDDMSIYEGTKNENGVSWSEPEPIMNSELKTLERSYSVISYYHHGDATASDDEHRKVSEWLWENRKVGDKTTIGQSKIEIIAMKKDIEYLKESTNGVFIQDVIVKKGQNGFVDDYNTSYIFSVKKLGWANIDRLFSNPKSKEIDLLVSIQNNDEFGYVYTSIILPEQNMYLPGYQKKDGTYSFSHGDSEKMVLPIGVNATILATAYKGDKPYYCIKKFTVNEKLDLSMNLEGISLSELKKELEKKI